MIGTPVQPGAPARRRAAREGRRAATPNDLVIAMRAHGRARPARDAMRRADTLPSETQAGQRPSPAARARTRAARSRCCRGQPGADLGARRVRRRRGAQGARARPARAALLRQRAARGRGRAEAPGAASAGCSLMGPDCGTALIAGTPLAFANAVPRGDIGIVSASGTGLQEVAALIARMGGGISHGIGVGGRDLDARIGALGTLAAIDALAADPATAKIVLISKPPAPEVALRVLERIKGTSKPCVVCFLGMERDQSPDVRRHADRGGGAHHGKEARAVSFKGNQKDERRASRGPVLRRHAVRRGRAHLPPQGVVGPQIRRPRRRRIHARQASSDDRARNPQRPRGKGNGESRGRAGPGGCRAGLRCSTRSRRRAAKSDQGPEARIASVTGTEQDPQGWSRQVALLREAGVVVAPSNAHAAELAASAVS